MSEGEKRSQSPSCCVRFPVPVPPNVRGVQVLVDGRPVLGGNSGSEIRVTMVGACGPRSGSGDSNALKMECREGGIVEEYQLNSATNNPDFVPELFSLEILTLVKAEPNLTLFQNTWLVGVEASPSTEGGGGRPRTITAAICEDQHSQRRYIVKAKVFIDATGDGRLGAEAGAEWLQGREGKDVYNESLAVPVSDNETEGTSILYQAADKGVARSFSAPAWASKYNQSEFRYVRDCSELLHVHVCDARCSLPTGGLVFLVFLCVGIALSFFASASLCLSLRGHRFVFLC